MLMLVWEVEARTYLTDPDVHPASHMHESIGGEGMGRLYGRCKPKDGHLGRRQSKSECASVELRQRAVRGNIDKEKRHG